MWVYLSKSTFPLKINVKEEAELNGMLSFFSFFSFLLLGEDCNESDSRELEGEIGDFLNISKSDSNRSRINGDWIERSFATIGIMTLPRWMFMSDGNSGMSFSLAWKNERQNGVGKKTGGSDIVYNRYVLLFNFTLFFGEKYVLRCLRSNSGIR